MFERDESVFDDRSVLSEDYEPSQIRQRKTELADYKEYLQPIIDNEPPRNIFAYGDTGVGKTVVTKYMLNKLQEDAEKYDDVDLKTVWVNVKNMTSYRAAVSLVNEFRDERNQISRSGRSADDVHSMLWDEINDSSATHIVFVLDEIDGLGTDDGLLYELPRASANGHIDDDKICLIGISNDFTYKQDLSGQVKDTLCEREVHFKPYDADQLREIITPRAEKAFVDGALNDEVIPLTAAQAGNSSGSARHALDILYKAGSLARRNDNTSVTGHYVREATKELEYDLVRSEIEAQPLQSHIALYALAELQQNGETPARKKDIYKYYRSVANDIDADVKTQRTVYNRLTDLAMKGFIDASTTNKGASGGRYNKYQIDVDVEMIMDIFESDTRMSEAMNAKITNY